MKRSKADETEILIKFYIAFIFFTREGLYSKTRNRISALSKTLLARSIICHGDGDLSAKYLK